MNTPDVLDLLDRRRRSLHRCVFSVGEPYASVGDIASGNAVPAAVCDYSIVAGSSPVAYSDSTNDDNIQLADSAAEISFVNKAMGSMAGMAIGDAVGAPLEFLNACDQRHKEHHFCWHRMQYTGEYNKFDLRRGQWTDDTSMGLCLCDSLLSANAFDGSDVRTRYARARAYRRAHTRTHTHTHTRVTCTHMHERTHIILITHPQTQTRALRARARTHTHRFWNWWFRGLNNAFRLDSGRIHGQGSVGLGGNIARSLFSMKAGETPKAQYKADTEDAGNGSLMRLAPVPIFFHRDIEKARHFAALSSYTTHPGPIAAEACKLLAHIIVRAMLNIPEADEQSPSASPRTPVQTFLKAVSQEYMDEGLASTQTEAGRIIIRLLLSAEPENSLERNWNWQSPSLDIEGTLRRRGHSYNGYPVSAGYFGSFSIDGLAVALHSVYHSRSFGETIETCVNHLGDADSTAAIAGLIRID